MGEAPGRPHVVIVGGGFGGLYAARALARAPVRVTLVDDAGGYICDSTVELTGTAYSGACPDCDFAYVTTGVVTKEAGYDCTYESGPSLWIADAAWVNTSLLPTRWLAFASTYTFPFGGPTTYDVLFAGMPYTSSATYPGSWSPMVYDTSFRGYAAYSKDLLTWTQSYTLPIPDWKIDYTCSGGSGVSGTSDYGGAYGSTTSMACGGGVTYDRWSFVAPATEYAYVTVDTVSDATSFNPYFFVTGDGCFIGIADDSFACTYPPKFGGNCPSYKMSVTAGVEYDVFVLDGGCLTKTIDYEIAIDTTGDPTLTLEGSSLPRFLWTEVDVDGSATLVP